jgi:hypothetical protein
MKDHKKHTRPVSESTVEQAEWRHPDRYMPPERIQKGPAPVVALRIPKADLMLARIQAERKGLPYQTYIKSLLHETLVKREKKVR